MVPQIEGQGLTCGASYRTTLNQRDKTDDHDEQMRLLKTCHQRCADRTLKVLEANGGIFIKLGQHLVCLSSEPCSWLVDVAHSFAHS